MFAERTTPEAVGDDVVVDHSMLVLQYLLAAIALIAALLLTGVS